MLGVLITIEPWLAGPAPGESPWLQSAMAVYVLHFVPLLAVALLLADAPVPVWVRIAVITLATTLATYALLRWLVWPFAPARRLFGIDPDRARP